MKIHHINLGTMCPYGGNLFDGRGGSIVSKGEMIIHALVVETNDGLVLVDTGIGLEDMKSPVRRLGLGFVAGCRPVLREEDTAVRQIERLGFKRSDVRNLVVTHLDVDHAGGIPDFPDAKIHVYRAEHAAAMAPATLNEKNRYRKVHFAGNPRWEKHDTSGDRWFGFDSVRAIADDVLMIPLPGHTRGHCAIAVRVPSAASAAYGPGIEWLLHCGDAYFFHDEKNDVPTCPAGLGLFQTVMAVDNDLRVANAARLRVLQREESSRVRIFCAHSPHEFEAAVRDTRRAVTAPAGATESRPSA